MTEQYIALHGRRLYGLCLTLCKNTFDADDLYQETWLKVHRSLDSFNERSAFFTWLTRICVNTYRDSLRRQKRNPVYDGFKTVEDKDYALENISADEKPDYSDVRAAVDRLPEKLRVTVILSYFMDFSEAQTAASLGIPQGTVKSRLSRAKKKLREELTNADSLQF